ISPQVAGFQHQVSILPQLHTFPLTHVVVFLVCTLAMGATLSCTVLVHRWCALRFFPPARDGFGLLSTLTEPKQSASPCFQAGQ
ncbi:MAG TPA: hypothetical protein VH593_20640, partial [Ktedonobacteraceae bacterium]